MRIEQFETRVLATLAEMRQEIEQQTLCVDHPTARVDQLEIGPRQLSERVDGLRQRFRVVNERLTELAA